MTSGTRHTYKQQLIKEITHMFRRSSLSPIPESCLRDMSTSSLAAFQEWIEPLIKENPSVTPASHRLPPKRKREE
jgi:hypothetical protein